MTPEKAAEKAERIVLEEIRDEYISILVEYFEGIVSNEYFDGASHQLYMDMDDMTFFISHEASDNSWLEREDGTLVRILTINAYANDEDEEPYNDKECNLYDYGFAEFIENIKELVSKLLEGEEDEEICSED
jgi:hypothetical protein